MTRIGLPGATLLTLALLTSACGGSSGSSGSPAKDTAPTKVQATAAAKAINLVQADVGADFKSTPADNSEDSENEDLKEIATCLGVDEKELGAEDSIVDLSSDDFAKGQPPSGVQVGSEVEVVASTAVAKKQLAVFNNAKTPDCLKKSFEKTFKDEIGSTPGLTLGTMTIEKIDVDSDDTDGAFGFAIGLPVNGPGITINVSVDIIGFLKKHTEVTLMTTSYGEAFASSDRDALYAKLVERAKTSAV